ncbi:MAG: ATP-binding protein [Pseudomonadota bacterium]|nr:ATP-binding protein [Pseudomonadota bacterium]
MPELDGSVTPANAEAEVRVRLENAMSVLTKVTHGHSALGDRSLLQALTTLQTSCFTHYESKEVSFKITIDDSDLDRQLQCDVYSVVYHLVKNALEHAKCSNLNVYLNQLENNLIIIVSDNGQGMKHKMQSVDFGLGLYMIKRIANAYSTKLKIRTGKDGTRVELAFPLQTKKHSNLTS